MANLGYPFFGRKTRLQLLSYRSEEQGISPTDMLGIRTGMEQAVDDLLDKSEDRLGISLQDGAGVCEKRTEEMSVIDGRLSRQALTYGLESGQKDGIILAFKVTSSIRKGSTGPTYRKTAEKVNQR